MTVLSVSSEDAFEIEPYLEQNGVNYPVARALGVGQLFGYTGVPHAWLIDATGTVTWEGHTNALTDADLNSVLGTAIQPGSSTGSGSATGGDTWWIWLIVGPAVLFMAAMGWFLWSSRDRTINYQTQIYQAPPAPPRAQGPPPVPQAPAPYGQPTYPATYGPPQAFPGQPGSSAMQEPYQGGNRAPGSRPNTRSVPRPASTSQLPMPEPVELPPEPEPPKAQHWLGGKPAAEFPPFDTNQNPQRGR